MGANENGVAVGNEAVWNRMSSDEVDLVPRYLNDTCGLQIVRSLILFQASWDGPSQDRA